jgi:hypothetical protein
LIRDPELCTPAGIEKFKELRGIARERGFDVHVVALRYALERFLARLFAARDAGRVVLDATAEHAVSADTLTLKGGLTMFLAEDVAPLDGRSTSDADFHVPHFTGGIEGFAAILRQVLATEPDGPDDGLRFDLASLEVAKVKEGKVPGGTVSVGCQIAKLPLKIKADLAFDHRPVHERARVVEYPSVLPNSGLAPVRVRCTPFSYTVADKVQAMVRHGGGNYRIRDYYDLFVILSRGKADLDEVPNAIAETFAVYESDLPASAESMDALSDAYAAAKAERWDVERKSKRYGTEVPALPEVVTFLREALDPLLARARDLPRPPF